MKLLEVKSRQVDVKSLRKRAALESDTDKVISEPCILTQNDHPVIIYGRFPSELSELSWAVRSISYNGGTRDNGLKTNSRTFGFCPRIPLRGHNYCSVMNLAYTNPLQHEVLCSFGKEFGTVYEQLAPEHYRKQKEKLGTIKSEWLIPGTPFTSGIVNQNNALKYHFDGGNFDGVMSCMVVLRKDCIGGNLSVPELNCRFLLQDRTYFLFDGQKLLHGVTPLKLLNKNSYRYSVVYYSIKAMAKCGTAAEELAFARASRMEMEKKRSTPAIAGRSDIARP